MPADTGYMTVDEVDQFIARHRWTFARTMAKNPHEYVLRERINDDVNFSDFVALIYDCGYKLKFGSYVYTCFDVGPHRYWAMGNPIPETRILNRALNVIEPTPVFHKRTGKLLYHELQKVTTA